MTERKQHWSDCAKHNEPAYPNKDCDCEVFNMNNEPVAYIDPYDLERLPHYDCHIGSQQLKNGIPLYTHPAKTLTDEEIMEIVVRNFGQCCYDNYFDSEWIYFARAILKKASEK